MTTLYKINIINAEGNSFSAEITFNPNHPVFAGHFPGQPVVPGVVLVEIASAAASLIAGFELTIEESTGMKFLNMIDPMVNPVVSIEGSIDPGGGEEYKASFRFYEGKVEFAKFKGVVFSPLAVSR